MIASIVDDMKLRRAKFARDVEYVKETALDDEIDERLEIAESLFMKETDTELKEAAKYVERISDEEDLVQESAEIDYLMNATENVSFNEMIGIE